MQTDDRARSCDPLSSLHLSRLFDSTLFFNTGKPFARRWTRESGGLGVVRFVQTDLSVARGALHSGTMRRRHSWGGDALRVS